MTRINPLIETEELAAAQDVLLFDVTAGNVADNGGAEITASQGFRAGHIPAARWLDQASQLSDLQSPYKFISPTLAQITRVFTGLGVSDSSTVVLYSQNGYGWPTRVWWLLQSIGFHRARILNGGLQKWRKEGRPLEQGDASPSALSAGELTLKPQPIFVDAERVQLTIGASDSTLIDALSPQHYRGEAAGKYGRSGHIPGALNVPADTLIGDDHRFLAASSLRERFYQAGAIADKPLLTYCGAGIAASVDAFAARLAGWEAITIYDASLAQWAADPAFPLEPAGQPSV
ncbi:rhodanese-like domain-containing protein [Erwiniaceae bacterium BAC15a-03b]|uniref:Rhodanese-like domain-containing protein n=1 Tax=Winslowiella arboricola TaxID=2978220 RepID=A0A9J6PTZ4_9GAMM|nr:rhodanese-like domain-containing protein [Winslowiella arboricola]MCU5772494.1 rhodanese-like domain-containing protein [Winslowiella arboricola]MCU5779016.1 rhodanese-like domain-containing protein [Winslowiella arboricola]